MNHGGRPPASSLAGARQVWTTLATSGQPARRLDRAIADSDADGDLVRATVGPVRRSTWRQLGPMIVGLTYGAAELPPHPLAADLEAPEISEIGYLFDPLGVESWEAVTFLLGVVLARRGQPIPVAVEALFASDAGEMSSTEKALVSMLGAALAPSVAIEAGTFYGAATARLARFSDRVVTIDWTAENARHVEHLANVAFVHGRAEEQLVPVLAANPEATLVLLDADHEAEGVAAEVRAVLDAPTPGVRVVAVHDAAAAPCWAGLTSVDWDRAPVVRSTLGTIGHCPVSNGWGGMALALLSSRPTGDRRIDLSRSPGEWWPTRGLGPRRRRAPAWVAAD
ncbi:class I SAM-dependent methyltransferase [Aquihabitans sp. G128]|uniref:class I SAM-dependent methyltransferase n=1 Tax=Aquihabitans sp. G128 TaxID=2849779 RepID=UPI001C21BB4C|nr:class I SAM-dependent methyltransferase [Aquihabitans sp. G128]QXC59313.1 class I SAM-dependent methyltransferase [Aquihabitans sp. G128]